MEGKYTKVTTNDVWFSYLPRTLSEAEMWKGTKLNAAGNRVTRNDFIDHFSALVWRLGNAPADRYAAKMGVSTTELFYTVKAITGVTPKDWILDLLRRAAAQLVDETNLSVNEMAAKLNFSHPSAFSRWYATHFKHPPRQRGKRRYR